MKKRQKPLIDKDGEVSELTAADMKRLRPARDVDAGFVARWKKSRGRPQGRSKAVISLSLDADIVAALCGSGKAGKHASTIFCIPLKDFWSKHLMPLKTIYLLLPFIGALCWGMAYAIGERNFQIISVPTDMMGTSLGIALYHASTKKVTAQHAVLYQRVPSLRGAL
jgi:uncharacterized protein (DUF4415 family)